ncbi:MAG TPA: hypothetical protein VHB78_04880 [Vicinamibacterales bacterium]|jgi:hypothetical protein|nr:hypothetical protein [Vicinamibacterales bacterium]
MRTRFAACLLAVALVASGGCGLGVDLEKALSVTDVTSGWYDFGLVGGLNKMVPQVSFRLKNVAEKPITQVQLIVSFWQDGADGELDSKNVDGIGSTAVTPGNATDAIMVRSDTGYTLEQPRNELFTNSQFKDFTAKVFAKRDGKIVRLGEFKIERRLLPHVDAALR